MQLTDKVAIVTGGGSGIGEALCERFLAEGARHVVVADLIGARAEEVAARLGERASAAQLDVADEAAIVALVEQTLERHGPIDLFVSNAGYGLRGGLELSNEAIEKMWQVHTMSHIYAARAVLPSMIARGEGYLLNTASAAGLLTQMDSLPYAVTKSAAVAVGEWLSLAHHHQGIRVSVLCPQAVRTRIAEAFGDQAAAPAAPAPPRASDAPKRGRDTGVGQASQDGVLEPAQLAQTVIECLAEERFLVLPHPQVQTYMERKAADRDRWLAGMRRFSDRLSGDRSRPGDWFVRSLRK